MNKLVSMVAVVLFLCSDVVSASDDITNIRWYAVSDTSVIVYYDLSGDTSGNISLYVSDDAGGSFTKAINVTGDIGPSVSPGLFKRIIWNAPPALVRNSSSLALKVAIESGETTPVSTKSAVSTETITIPRLSDTITFDGMPDETAWKSAPSFPAVMQTPHFGGEPSERTEIMAAYDDDYFYVAARLYDSDPAQIQASTMKRDDDDEKSDCFGFILDTFNDNENALMFVTTPNGSRIDKAIYGDMLGGGSASGGANSNWNTFWDAKTVRNEEGWFVEIRIPLSSLRFQENSNGVVMGFSAFRWIARKDERVVFPAISQEWGKSSHLKPSKSHRVLFKDIDTHRPLYITPYVLGGIGQTFVLNDAGTDYTHDDEPAHEAGLDIKYGLTGNMTLDVTYNTDFAQVEADDQQVNLTRFSLFFPEKRLFFLERESNFDFRFYGKNRLFHSRRIGIENGKQVPILGGARAYGRAGKWDVGILSMQTDKMNDLPSENFGVLRLRRQVFNQYSYLGSIVTSRMGDTGTYNTAYGIDGSIRVFGDDIFKFNWAQTFENDADNNPRTLDISKIRAHWERYKNVGWAYGLNYSRAGERYNPGMGFEQYDNMSSYIHFVRYGWNGSRVSRWFQQEVYEDFWLHVRNTDNTIKTCLARAGWHGDTKSGYYGHLTVAYNYENVKEPLEFSETCNVPFGTYEFFNLIGNFSTPSGRLMTLSSSFQGGRFYDGTRVTVSVSPSKSVSSNLEIGATYELNAVDFPDRNQEFTSHIGRFRFLAMLNTKFSITAFTQYSNTADTVINNIRLRYNPKEGNDLYIVYDEAFNMNRDREDPILPVTKNRTILLKYNYTLNL